ncbi:hypothetical protein CspHIS471_0203420 [Cutaneotrichosporon sp. HIS471]|nr:hypothetical protein CspHIS471_0203420 [Cutaneotrichosporon sp. HIS471]
MLDAPENKVSHTKKQSSPESDGEGSDVLSSEAEDRDVTVPYAAKRNSGPHSDENGCCVETPLKRPRDTKYNGRFLRKN